LGNDSTPWANVKQPFESVYAHLLNQHLMHALHFLASLVKVSEKPVFCYGVSPYSPARPPCNPQSNEVHTCDLYISRLVLEGGQLDIAAAAHVCTAARQQAVALALAAGTQMLESNPNCAKTAITQLA
jgi:hypothetical protein